MDLEQFKILFELHKIGVESLSTAAERRASDLKRDAAVILAGDIAAGGGVNPASADYLDNIKWAVTIAFDLHAEVDAEVSSR